MRYSNWNEGASSIMQQYLAKSSLLNLLESARLSKQNLTPLRKIQENPPYLIISFLVDTKCIYIFFVNAGFV